jgi:hypothetical protein
MVHSVRSLRAQSTVVKTTGYVIVRASSSCGNLQEPDAHELIAFALKEKGTCHFDVELDDGEQLSFDAPFTSERKECCCDSCQTVFVTSSPILISAPSGYTPKIDGGADASLDTE